MKVFYTIATKYHLGNVISCSQCHSSQNDVYKVDTDKGIYIVKKFNLIKNNKDLYRIQKQIDISRVLNDNNIRCLLPIKYKTKNFIRIDGCYYAVYPYVNQAYKSVDEMSNEDIKTIAVTQSNIHKLRVTSHINKTYQRIKINLNVIVDQNDRETLRSLIEKCNCSLNKMEENLCISHNDYKPLNMLWDDEGIVLLDFDAAGLANPTCAMCESAFIFSKSKSDVNLEKYTTYIRTYYDDYGPFKENFEDALYVAMNGKLRWLRFLINENRVEEANIMIKELVLYYKYVPVFLKLYNEIKEN